MKRIFITESNLQKLIKRSIKEVLNNTKRPINEINYIAKQSPITVCSLDDFVTICQNIGVNDNNAENFVGEYCFIEIGSTQERCKYDAYYTHGYDKWSNDGDEYYNNGQYYFKSEHSNVLHLEFDDNINISDKGGLTNVTLSASEFRNDADLTKHPNVSSKGFKYNNAKGFSMALAHKADDFIEQNIQNNPNVKFVIHCRMGQSRSGAMGYYLAQRLKVDIQKYLSEYDVDYTYQNKDATDTKQFKGSQFRLGVNRKGGVDTMNNRVSKMMSLAHDKRNGIDNKEYDKIEKQGEYGKFNLKSDDEFHKPLRDYVGDKDNPKIYRSVKGYDRIN